MPPPLMPYLLRGLLQQELDIELGEGDAGILFVDKTGYRTAVREAGIRSTSSGPSTGSTGSRSLTSAFTRETTATSKGTQSVTSAYASVYGASHLSKRIRTLSSCTRPRPRSNQWPRCHGAPDDVFSSALNTSFGITGTTKPEPRTNDPLANEISRTTRDVLSSFPSIRQKYIHSINWNDNVFFYLIDCL